jgi:alanine dehydrogenase
MGTGIRNYRGQPLMLHITEQQVIDTLSMPKAIELVEKSFRELADRTAINHPRRRVILPTGSILHYMAAGNPEYFGIKIYSSNPKTGAHFQFLLYRSSDGLQVANIEANHLGRIRTGAASGVATRYLAREDADTLGIVGTGFQAETQIAALSHVRKIREVRVWSRKPDRRAQFARACAEKFGLEVRATDTAREAVEGAGIVVTATNSKEPVIESGWIAPGTHINAMGSNWLNRRELPTDLVLDRADLVTVDSVEDAHLESGDLMIPLKERPGAAFAAVELCEVIARRIPGRTSPTQITIFKSNGLAAQDVAVAGYVAAGLGSPA